VGTLTEFLPHHEGFFCQDSGNGREPSGTRFATISIDFNQMSAFSQCSDEKLSIKFSIDDNRNVQGAGAVRQGRGFVASVHVTGVLKPPFAPLPVIFAAITAREHCLVT
jgi:hypothetical protein